MTDVEAGWYPDPTARSPLRYWDGARWTDFVSSGPGTRSLDALGGEGAAGAVPAGWYPNPVGSGLRYWDGQNWTEHESEGRPTA